MIAILALSLMTLRQAGAANHMDIGAVESLTTAAPVFSLAGGSYHTPQTLILTDSTPGAVIYYTYTPNGTTPTTLSTQKCQT